MKLKINFFAMLAFAALMFYACQPEMIAPTANFNPATSVERNGDCETQCIEDADTWSESTTYVQTFGTGGAARTHTIEVRNNGTQIEYSITSTWDPIRRVDWSGVSPSNSMGLPQPVVLVKEIGTDWDACDVDTEIFGIRQNVGVGMGGSDDMTVEYSLIGYCCEDSFDYVDNGDGTYTFTYVSTESISDAHLVFTFAQGSYVGGLVGWSAAGVTMQTTMDVVACEVYSWTVELAPNCGGVGQPNANLWTDFKVNDESLKGDLENIVVPCP